MAHDPELVRELGEAPPTVDLPVLSDAPVRLGAPVVYGAYVHGTALAVKVLRRSLGQNVAGIDRFARELYAVAELDHPSVPECWGYGTTSAPSRRSDSSKGRRCASRWCAASDCGFGRHSASLTIFWNSLCWLIKREDRFASAEAMQRATRVVGRSVGIYLPLRRARGRAGRQAVRPDDSSQVTVLQVANIPDGAWTPSGRPASVPPAGALPPPDARSSTRHLVWVAATLLVVAAAVLLVDALRA